MTETSLITESDQSGTNHQLLQLCTARTAWSDSDQSVRAVHSCISWLLSFIDSVSLVDDSLPSEERQMRIQAREKYIARPMTAAVNQYQDPYVSISF